MASDANNLLLHIKKAMYSSIRLGYRSCRDYPVVLGTGIFLLFLHRSFPSLFAFVLSSSPVFLLTALLLGALLSYGEPNVPKIEEEMSVTQKISSLKSKISIADCSLEEIENATVQNHAEKRTENEDVCIEEKTSYDAHYKEDNTSSIRDATLSYAKSSVHVENNVILERGDQIQEVTEKAEQKDAEAESSKEFQFGEFMSSCWQPVMRHDPDSDSESDLTESSPDASMTDIIPMLEELQPLIELETAQPPSTTKDNLNASANGADKDDEDEEDHSEAEDHDTEEDEGANGGKENGHGIEVTWTEENQKDVMELNSSELEKNSKLESLMERRRAKNILKFELDMNLMEMQAADAMQKMEEASRFRVHVPSISTPRTNPFDLPNDPEETIELPQVPDSAPSVLLPRKNLFDLPFDQIVDRSACPRETWSPRSYVSAPQRNNFFRRHENFDGAPMQDMHTSKFNPSFVPGIESYGGGSTNLQYHNGIKLEEGEISGIDACNSQADSGIEQTEKNVELFGSLGAHISEEIKILSAAISEAGVLEHDDSLTDAVHLQASNSEADLSEKVPSSGLVKAETPFSDMEQHTGQQSTLHLPPEETNSELHFVEATSIEEINSLFKHLKEQVSIQSVSEPNLGKPSTVKLEIEPTAVVYSNFGLNVVEASPPEEQLHAESKTYSSSTSGSVDEAKSLFKQEEAQSHSLSTSAPSEASKLNLEFTSRVHWSTDIEINSEFKELQGEYVDSILDSAFGKASTVCHSSKLHVAEAKSAEEISIQCKPLLEDSPLLGVPELPSPGIVDSSELHAHEASTVEEINSLFKQLNKEAQKQNVEAGRSERSSEMHVVEASLVEELNPQFKQLSEDAQMLAASELACGSELIEANEEALVARSIEEINLSFEQHQEEVHKHAVLESSLSADSEQPVYSDLHVFEVSTLEESNSVFKKLHDEINIHSIHNVSDSIVKLEDSPNEPVSVDIEESLHNSEPPVAEECSFEETNAEVHAILSSLDEPDDELPVLEATSDEEINLLFKQLEDEEEKLHSSELEESRSHTTVLDVKSVEDIDSAFKKLSNGYDNIEMPQEGGIVLEPMESNSEMQVIEAKSLDDIHLALKQLSGDTSSNASKAIELKGKTLESAT